jgi:hypothetical protein
MSSAITVSPISADIRLQLASPCTAAHSFTAIQPASILSADAEAAFVRVFGSDLTEIRRALATPPGYCSVRVNTLKMTREEGLECMRGALAGGGQVVGHDVLPDVIMCYPACKPEQDADVAAGDHAADATRATRDVPVAHEVFVTARTAEVILVTPYTSLLISHTFPLSLFCMLFCAVLMCFPHLAPPLNQRHRSMLCFTRYELQVFAPGITAMSKKLVPGTSCCVLVDV